MTEAVHLPSLADAAAVARAQGDRARLVRLLCRRATLLASSGDFAGALFEADEALDVARDLGDPLLLARALAAVHVSCWPPDLQERAVHTSAELVDAAAASGDLDLAIEAEVARMVDGLRGGDLAMMDDALSRAAAVAERSQSPRHEFFVLSRRATRAIIDGRLSEAMTLLAHAEEIGEAIQEPDTFQVYWGAQFLVLPETHSRDELLQFVDFLGQFPQDDPLLHAVVANFHAMAGNTATAGELLARALVGVEQITQHGDLAILTLMARAASKLERPELAARVERLLRPFGGRLVVNAGAVTFCGAVDHWLGLLAQVQGRVDEARELLTSALADYERMGATWFIRWTAAALQALEPASGVAAPGRRHAVLRRLEDGWQVGWEGHEARVADARGLHHLHTLLRAAGREVHAADLMRPGASAQLTSHAREALLDDTAKHAYRARIQQLQAIIAEAEDDGEVERRAEAQAEVDALLDELRRAVGLHGHDRRPADDGERARVAVRKAVTATLTRLAEHDASFATHLRSSVRTGLRCSYQPDPTIEISWSL